MLSGIDANPGVARRARGRSTWEGRGMTGLTWLLVLVTAGINLHALVALVIARGKPAPVLARLAKRSRWLALGFIVLSATLSVLAVRQAASATTSGNPAASARAEVLAMQISAAMNCAAF